MDIGVSVLRKEKIFDREIGEVEMGRCGVGGSTVENVETVWVEGRAVE